MGLNVVETNGGGRALETLIDHAVQDMVAYGLRGRREQFVLITPARLRPYAERHVLAYLNEHPINVPGITLDVHSFTSMARSMVGNRYDGRYAKPVVNPFTVRAFLASRMRHDTQTFRAAGNTFGSTNQFASQVIELINASIRPDDIARMPNADDRLRAVAKLLAQVENEFGDFTMPGANASVIVPWVEDHGTGLHAYLYGFEWMSADELLMTQALTDSADCVLCTEAGCRPDFVNVLESLESNGGMTDEHDGTFDTLPNVLQPPVAPTAYCVSDECDEVRQTVGLITMLRDQAEHDGTPFSYGDILVTARDLGPYRAMLEDEFAYHGIPVNATPAATMADQPLASLLLGLLDARLYDAVPDATVLLRVFRSRLLRGRYRIANRDIDRVQDALYTADPVKVWNEQTNSSALREAVARMRTLVDEARPVFMGTDGTGNDDPRTVRETLTDMVRFLVRVGANLSWTEIVADGKQSGDPDNSQERREAQQRLFAQTRTVWNLIMREFDSLVERFGDEPFADFRPTFAANLETMLLEQPLHDKTRASNAVDVIVLPTPMRPYKHVFVLGATESQLPAIPGETGLLDETERLKLADALDSQGKRVAAAGMRFGTVHIKARREILSFNRLVAYAGNLTFLCARTSGGAAQALSPLVAELLPNISLHNGSGRDRTQTIDDLAELRDDMAHPLALHDASAAPLDPALMTELFTKHDNPNDSNSPLVFDTSVSAIQQFYGNPFESFLNRGLNLQPVKPFELTSAIQGSFYHAVLERLIDVKVAAQRHANDPDSIPADYRNGSTLKSDDELIDLLAQLEYVPAPIAGGALATVSLLEEDPDFAILVSSQRMHVIHEQLTDTLHTFLRRLQLTVGSWQDMLLDGATPAASRNKGNKKKPSNPSPSISLHDTPLFAEKQFGDIRTKRADWPALTSAITGGTADDPTRVTVRVRGKVDRIDRIERNGHEGALVIDYKSSGHILFDSKKETAGSLVYYGHELQLLTYARAAMASGEQLPPIAGLLFLPIQKEKDMRDLISKVADLTAEVGDPTQSRRLCDTGLHLPTTKKLPLGTAGALVAPWARAKALGVLPAVALQPQELELLCDYVRRMIEQACQAMLAGTMPVAPYKTVKDDDSNDEYSQDGLKFSDYPDVMALDMLNDRAWRMQRPVSLAQLQDAARQPVLPDVIGVAADVQQESEQ